MLKKSGWSKNENDQWEPTWSGPIVFLPDNIIEPNSSYSYRASFRTVTFLTWTSFVLGFAAFISLYLLYGLPDKAFIQRNGAFFKIIPLLMVMYLSFLIGKASIIPGSSSVLFAIIISGQLNIFFYSLSWLFWSKPGSGWYWIYLGFFSMGLSAIFFLGGLASYYANDSARYKTKSLSELDIHSQNKSDTQQ